MKKFKSIPIQNYGFVSLFKNVSKCINAPLNYKLTPWYTFSVAYLSIPQHVAMHFYPYTYVLTFHSFRPDIFVRNASSLISKN